MWLVKAYQGNGQTEEAIALCQDVQASESQALQIWAQQFVDDLNLNQRIWTQQ